MAKVLSQRVGHSDVAFSSAPVATDRGGTDLATSAAQNDDRGDEDPAA